MYFGPVYFGLVFGGMWRRVPHFGELTAKPPFLAGSLDCVLGMSSLLNREF